MRAILTAMAILVASPASAQLTPEAFTWGVEVHAKADGADRATIISAQKRGNGWSVEMLCEERRGGKVARRRWKGTATWSGTMMLATLNDAMQVVVVPRDDGDLGVVTSGSFCAHGPGMLTSGGG